jgi:DNA polymerase-1
MDKLIIIDGPAVMHRAWHALPKLTDPKGRVVSAVYGFTSLLLKLWREHKPQYLVVTLDTKEPTFRHEAYKEYKAGRVKQPQEFYDQFSILKDLLKAFGIKYLERPGFEADDLIGSVATHSPMMNLIVTGDLDTLQLIKPNTEVYFLHKGLSDLQVYNEEAVMNRFGLKPEQLIDFKALRGDPSDNISGIKGIGEKTALALIQKFGNLENIYQYLDKWSDKKCEIKDSLREILSVNKDKAFFDQNLVTIKKDLGEIGTVEDYRLTEINNDAAIAVLQNLGFNSLVKRLENGDRATIARKKKSPPPEQQRSLF